MLKNGSEGKHYRILFKTDQFPTDPIVLRLALTPDRSALGRELKVALKDFFKRSPDVPRSLSVENAGMPPFDKLRRDLRLLDGIDRGTSPAPLAPASAQAITSPTATPMPTPSITPVLPDILHKPRPAMPAGKESRS